jgi:hypothetical protein
MKQRKTATHRGRRHPVEGLCRHYSSLALLSVPDPQEPHLAEKPFPERRAGSQPTPFSSTTLAERRRIKQRTAAELKAFMDDGWGEGENRNS